jgi:hypothetical protein
MNAGGSTILPGTPIAYTAMGGARSSISFPDISNWRDPSLFATIAVSVLIVDTVVLFLARYFPDTFGKPLNEWYDQFNLSAVVSDVGIIVIGFVLAQLLYTQFFAPTHGWNLWIFLAVLVVVQVLHDLFFNTVVIQGLPKGHNEMIDTMKEYAKGAGAMILVGDALLMLASAAVTMVLKDQSLPTLLFAGLGALYALPYILTTRWQVNSTKKPEKKEVEIAMPPTPPPTTYVTKKEVASPQQFPQQFGKQQPMDSRDVRGGEGFQSELLSSQAPFSQDVPFEPIPSNFYG